MICGRLTSWLTMACLYLTGLWGILPNHFLQLRFPWKYLASTIYYSNKFYSSNSKLCEKKHLLCVLNSFPAPFTVFVLLGLVCSTSTYLRVTEEILPSLRLTVPMANSLTISFLNNLRDYFSIGLCGFFFTGLLTPYGFPLQTTTGSKAFTNILALKFWQDFIDHSGFSQVI